MPCKNCLRCVQRKNSFPKVPYRILCHKRRLNGIGSHLTEIFICSFIQQKSTDHSKWTLVSASGTHSGQDRLGLFCHRACAVVEEQTEGENTNI